MGVARDVLIPDPLSSDRQRDRFYHLDFANLEDMELTDELYALHPLLWGLDPDHWLRERCQKLENELRKRQWRETEYKIPKPKPKPAEGVRL
jgi:hypothetical protein